MKAALTPTQGADFDVCEVVLDDPREGEVLVRIAGVGLCHTDVVARDGGMGASYPALFGHEGAGVVEKVGSGVTKVVPGDHVILTFNYCGSCARCDAQEMAYCEDRVTANYFGRRKDGSTVVSHADKPVYANFFGQSSFAPFAIANEQNTVKVTKEMPLEIAGSFGCGIQTGAGAVMRSLACEKGSSIVIVGGGSVGLAAVLGAVLCECTSIIVIEPHEARRTLSREIGATMALAPDEIEALRKEFPKGVDYVLDTSGAPAAYAMAPLLLRSRGTFGFLGVPPITQMDAGLPGSLRQVLSGGFTYRGIIEGDSVPDEFIPELVRHFLAGHLPVDKLIQFYPLTEINQAVADQKQGLCVKACLVP